MSKGCCSRRWTPAVVMSAALHLASGFLQQSEWRRLARRSGAVNPHCRTPGPPFSYDRDRIKAIEQSLPP